MVKFTLLLCGAAMLAGLAMPTRNAAAAPAETKDDLKSLVQKYLAADGLYTKKTTIGLNDASKQEHVEYFHASLVEAKRTTYYAPNKLLLAAEDGSIPVGSGSYYFDSADSKVHRAGALEGSDESNMWENLDAGYVAYRDEVTKLEDKFVTLNTFAAADYFAAWGYDSSSGVYYYDLTEGDKAKDAEGVYACAMWNDFLAFCAPMLYAKSGAYLSAKSLTVQEKFDHSGTSYLALSMYLDSVDEGKLDESYLAEARIYVGNRVFKENTDFAVYLVGTVGGQAFKQEMIWDAAEEQNEVENLALSKGDCLEIWDTNNNYHHVYQHVWDNAIEYGGTYNNQYKVGMSSKSYGFYYKPSEDKTYISASKDLMWFKPNQEIWDKDGAKFSIEFKDANGASISTVALENPDADGYYKYEVPHNAKKCVYNRLDSNRSTVWNHSGECELANFDWNNTFFQWKDSGYDGWNYGTYNVGSWSIK